MCIPPPAAEKQFFNMSSNTDDYVSIVIAPAGNESFKIEKFQSRLNPWGDYLFGFVLLLIGESSR